MQRIFIAALLAVCVAATPVAVLAADPPAEKPAQGKGAAKPKTRPFRGTVKAFDQTAKTVTLAGEKGDTFLITSKTKIFKDRDPATTEDIKAGEQVRGFAQENAEGKWEALSLYIGAPGARAVPPAEKGKEGEKKAK